MRRNRLPKQLAETDYDAVILELFRRHYREGIDYFVFDKDEIAEVCAKLSITIRNTPDLIYSYRSRKPLPNSIRKKGHWALDSAGRGKYAFRLLSVSPHFEINLNDFTPIEIFNAIPEAVEGLLRKDEQSLLTKLLYNRLIDLFTGLTCYHIQNHYRSFVKHKGEVEVDAVYTGADRFGTLYIIPIEAKSEADSELLGRIQVTQMVSLVKQDFPSLKRRILAAKALADGTIGLVEFTDHDIPDEIGIATISRFKLIRRNS